MMRLIAIAAALFSAALAQTPGAALDSALSEQRAASEAVDLKVNDGIADLIARIEAEELARSLIDAEILIGVEALAERLRAIEARVEALEAASDGGSGPIVTPPPVTSALYPNTDDGLPILQLGLCHHKDWGGCNPYKNQRLLMPEYGGAAKVEKGEADPTTGWIFINPGERLILGRVRPLQVKPANFDIDPGVWILTATVKAGDTNGPPTVRLLAGDFKDAGSALIDGAGVIRLAADMTGKTDARQLSLDGGANGGWIRVDFWGPEKFEDDPQGWHPDFLADVSRYKILRFLDWTQTIGARITRASEWIDDGDYTVYGDHSAWRALPAANGALMKGGYSFARIFDLTKRAQNSPHITIPLTLGADVIKDEILLCGTKSDGREGLKSAIAANRDAILAAAKIEFRALADKMARAAIATGFPDHHVILVEFGNETWNYGNSGAACSSDYAAGMGRALTGSDDLGYGYGYISAIGVEAFKERFGALKPAQALQFVMGWQTGAADGVGGFRARKSIEGFKAYKTDYAADLIDVFAGTTGYWLGAFKWNNARSPGAGNPFGALTEADFNAAFEAQDRADRLLLFKKARDFHLGPPAHDNVAAVVANNRALLAIAIEGGMRGILQYEGSAHENALTRTGQLGLVYPASLEAWQGFARSAEAEAVQLALIDDLAAIDPINPAVTSGWAPRSLVVSDFQSVCREAKQGSPWCERAANETVTIPARGIASAWAQRTRQPIPASHP